MKNLFISAQKGPKISHLFVFMKNDTFVLCWNGYHSCTEQCYSLIDIMYYYSVCYYFKLDFTFTFYFMYFFSQVLKLKLKLNEYIYIYIC